MKFDDGFVAYLNGKRLAEANAPAPPGWNSAASGGNDDSSAMVYREFDVTSQLPSLRRGENVLAVHVMNDGLQSSDMLMVAQLMGVRRLGGATLKLPDTFSKVHARALDGGTWSFPSVVPRKPGAVPASAANVIVSEVMYHPGKITKRETKEGFDDADSFEFIELANVSDSPVDLTMCAFIEGVHLEFANTPNTLIPAHGRVVVVENEPAFRTRYGDDVTVAGAYQGNLDNGGDRIVLVAEAGAMIANFAYEDGVPWPQEADGSGKSLTLASVVPSPTYTDPTSWRPSESDLGSPGR